MPNSASALIKKILAELYYCSILFIKKISEESIEFQVCFILGIVAVPIAFTTVFSVTRCKRRQEATERSYSLVNLSHPHSGTLQAPNLHELRFNHVSHIHHQCRSNTLR